MGTCAWLTLSTASTFLKSYFCDMFIEEVYAVEQRRSRNMGVFELIIELRPRAGIAAVGNGEFNILRQVGVAAHHHNCGCVETPCRII